MVLPNVFPTKNKPKHHKEIGDKRLAEEIYTICLGHLIIESNKTIQTSMTMSTILKSQLEEPFTWQRKGGLSLRKTNS